MSSTRTMGAVLRVTAGALLMTTALSAHSADVSVISSLLSVYPGANGTYTLTFSDDAPSCSSPNTPKRFAVKIGENGMTSEGAKQIYAAALAALLADKNVHFTFSDLTTDCFINRLQLLK